MTRRVWAGALAGLVAFRVAIPLAALAASGSSLPGMPRYEYAPLNGDSFGFYAAARELLASFGRVGIARLAVVGVALAVLAAALWLLRRRRPDLSWLALALGGLGVSLALAVVIDRMAPSGGAVVGWPLVWALPMLPYRALGGPLDPDVAFLFGLPLTLAAIAVAVVATAYVGYHASGRRSVGVAAAALFAAWPFIVTGLVGERAWENGQWNVDVGLHLYTEPLSTALVAVALALVVAPRVSDVRLAAAGMCLSFAVAVKLTNVLVAALVLAFVAWRLRRGAVPFGAGLASLAAISIVYWPKGYPTLFDDPQAYSPRAWAADYVLRNWTESLWWTPTTLLVLAPLALLGARALPRPWTATLLGGLILSQAALYSFYDVTRYHPRFLHVTLPALLALEAAGAVWAVRRLSAGRGRRPAPG